MYDLVYSIVIGSRPAIEHHSNRLLIPFKSNLIIIIITNGESFSKQLNRLSYDVKIIVLKIDKCIINHNSVSELSKEDGINES